MDIEPLLKELEKVDFKVSTDTRKDISGTVYFALRGESFDGNTFVSNALQKGAIAAVTDNLEITGENIFHVEDVLKTLQEVAQIYRQSFTIPIIAIGGSNGKTTSKDLIRSVLGTKYKVHATEGSLNNHIGVPLSILSMKPETEIGIFEIGANHLGEHKELLDILHPTHAVVTNNGMDHMGGFGGKDGSRRGNKEIYDWAKTHEIQVFVHTHHLDLIEDSEGSARILYPTETLKNVGSTPLALEWNNTVYETHLVGNYNTENIELAVSIGSYFKIDPDLALRAISTYIPLSKRSELLIKGNTTFIIDCYNANPTSMILALESFIESPAEAKGVVLGDMLELGEYSDEEHKKIVEYVLVQNFQTLIFVGKDFKKALEGVGADFKWFSDSDTAREWFKGQKFDNYTILLKGSRGSKIEKILDL